MSNKLEQKIRSSFGLGSAVDLVNFIDGTFTMDCPIKGKQKNNFIFSLFNGWREAENRDLLDPRGVARNDVKMDLCHARTPREIINVYIEYKSKFEAERRVKKLKSDIGNLIS